MSKTIVTGNHPLYNEWNRLTKTMKFTGASCDPNWLIDNGQFTNKDHPNLQEALKVAKEITQRTRWDNRGY